MIFEVAKLQSFKVVKFQSRKVGEAMSDYLSLKFEIGSLRLEVRNNAISKAESEILS